MKTFVGRVHFQSTCPGATELKKYFSGPASTGIIFMQRLFGFKWIFLQAIFISGHFLNLLNSRTFPRPGK